MESRDEDILMCDKCNAEYGIMIEDGYGNLCGHCHPYAITSFNSSQEVLNKIEHLDFNNVRERKY